MDDITSCVKETALLLKDAVYLETHYQRVLAHLLQKKKTCRFHRSSCGLSFTGRFGIWFG